MFAMALACLGSARAGQPFAIQVTDEDSQRGVPMVTLETDNHIRLITDSAGWAIFEEPGLTGHSLHLSVSSPGYALPKDADGRSGIVLTMAPGQAAEIKLLRTQIAERLYRFTGQGIFRESTLLGKDAPLPFPNINGDVLSLGKAQAAPYQGKLIWAWTDARFATSRSAFTTTGAAADLPGAGGLDPTQGVHLRYFTNEQEESISLLTVPKGQHALLEGLISLKDAAGAEHLLARYVFINAAGASVEQGIAEFNDRHTFDRKIVLGEEYTWQFPAGHAVEVKREAGDFIYFATPFCTTRVPASYEAALSPTSYEALAWSEDAHKLVWQQEHAPITQGEEAQLVDRRSLREANAHCHLVNGATDKSLTLVEGSIQWNACRQCWVLIGTSAGTEATPGDVWYAEADEVAGPWSNAIQIATHAGHTFSGIAQLAALQQEGGRYIYFEGTLGTPASSSMEPLPRYHDNQLMYRLDVKDQRLAPARR